VATLFNYFFWTGCVDPVVFPKEGIAGILFGVTDAAVAGIFDAGATGGNAGN
jgi:hypothetical protein